MSSTQAATLVLFLSWTGVHAKDVLCVYKKSCLLPCNFTYGAKPVIQWTTGPEHKIRVHSFYCGQSQFNYSGRSFLSDEEVKRGNASLLLTEVKPQDGGEYRCYSGTKEKAEESLVNLQVHAPVSEVLLEEDGPAVKCVCTDVFPEPSVSWSPPSDHSLSVTSSLSGLFSVTSSVNITQSSDEYSCNISTEHSWRSATYRRTAPINSTNSEETIPCPLNSSSPIQSRVWTFNGTHIIVNQSGSQLVYNKTWKTIAQLSESGDLHLKDLTKEHEGLFSCDVTTDRETFSNRAELTITGAQGRTEPGNPPVAMIVGLCVGALVLVAAITGVALIPGRDSGLRRKRAQTDGAQKVEEDEVREDLMPRNEAPAENGTARYAAKTETVHVDVIGSENHEEI